jgi:hypothetical protein
MFAIFGCASPTRIVSQWKDSSIAVEPLKKPYVIVVSKDAMRRRVWEESFVKELKARGVEAVPSYIKFPAQTPTEAEVKALVAEGLDGVVVTWYRGTEEQSTYVPGSTSMQPDLVYDPWWGRYTTVYTEVYQEGYVETDEIRSFETTVWTPHRPSRDTPYWSAYTELVTPSSYQENSVRVARVVVEALEKDAVIPSR